MQFLLARIIFLHLFSLLAGMISGQTCSQTNFDRYMDKRLRCGIFKTITAQHDACQKLCAATLSCFSTNTYQNDSEGTDVCELVRGTKDSLGEDGCFEIKQGGIHSSLLSSTMNRVRKALKDGWFQLGSSAFKFFSTMPKMKASDVQAMCSNNQAGLTLKLVDQLERKFVSELFPESVIDDSHKVQEMAPAKHWKLDGSDSDVQIHGEASYQDDDDTAIAVLTLPGTSRSYATTPTLPISQKNFTISFWIKSSDFNQFLSSKFQVYSSWDNSNHVFAISPGEFTARKVYHQKSTRFMVKSSSILTNNQWANVVGTWYWYGENGKATLYVDDVKINEQNVHDTNKHGLGFPNPPVNVFDIGFNRETSDVMTGKIRDIVVFYRPLAAEEIKNLKGFLDRRSSTTFICKKTL